MPTSNSHKSRSVHPISPVESLRSTCASLTANVLESAWLYAIMYFNVCHLCMKAHTHLIRSILNLLNHYYTESPWYLRSLQLFSSMLQAAHLLTCQKHLVSLSNFVWVNTCTCALISYTEFLHACTHAKHAIVNAAAKKRVDKWIKSIFIGMVTN